MNLHRILKHHPDLFPSEKLLFSILYDMAGQKGYCWPSQTALGSATGLSRQTVCNALKTLEEKGLIVSNQRRREDGGTASKVYKIVAVEALPLSRQATPPLSRQATPPVASGDTKFTNEVLKKKEKTTTTPSAFQSSESQAVLGEKLCVKDLGTQATSPKAQPKAVPAEKRFDKDQGGASTSKSESPPPPAEKLCVEKIDPSPVVNGGGQRQPLPDIPGLSTSTAEGLAKKHGIARLLEVASLSKDKRNPAGWARAALEGGWLTTPPAVAVDTKKNEEYKQLMVLWEAMPEQERRRAYLRGGGFGSPEMPNPSWLKKFFNDQAGRKAM